MRHVPAMTDDAERIIDHYARHADIWERWGEGALGTRERRRNLFKRPWLDPLSGTDPPQVARSSISDAVPANCLLGRRGPERGFRKDLLKYRGNLAIL